MICAHRNRDCTRTSVKMVHDVTSQHLLDLTSPARRSELVDDLQSCLFVRVESVNVDSRLHHITSRTHLKIIPHIVWIRTRSYVAPLHYSFRSSSCTAAETLWSPSAYSPSLHLNTAKPFYSVKSCAHKQQRQLATPLMY